MIRDLATILGIVLAVAGGSPLRAQSSTPASPPTTTPRPGLPPAAPLKTDDFFAGDLELTKAMVRLLHAVHSAERADKAEADDDLVRGLETFREALAKARSQGTGPWRDPGNRGLEALVALHVAKILALTRLESSGELREDLLGLARPAPRFISTDIAGIPMINQGDPTRAMVALTFDDGPEPPGTPKVLDVLDRHGVRGTFFVVGRAVDAHPALLRRIREAGHEIASHSYTHPRLTKLSDAEIRSEVERTDDAIARAVPELPPVDMFRLPFQIGDRSKRVQAVLAERFKYLVDWTVDSQDYLPLSVDQILRRTAKPAQVNGAIVLFHDRRPDTAAAVDRLIPQLEAAGFAFGTVSEVMGIDAAGDRAQWLVKGLDTFAGRRYTEAGKELGNYTLRHPDAPSAPAALYAAWRASTLARRPKADKLRDALLRRYPQTVFAHLCAGTLPAWERFTPGGALRPPKARVVVSAAPPPKSPRPPPLGPDGAYRSAAPTVATSSVGGTLPTTGTAPVRPAQKLLQTLRAKRPPPPPRPARAKRPAALAAPKPPPLPTPYRDPEPRLTGRHLVDPLYQ